MKHKLILLLTFLTLFMIGCFDVVTHNHADHAFQSQKYVIYAIYLENGLHIEKYKVEYTDLMKSAIHESRLAKRSELNGLYDNWGDMFHDYLIKGAQLTIEGNSESDPKISLQKLSQATEYINKYADWFEENAYAMGKNWINKRNNGFTLGLSQYSILPLFYSYTYSCIILPIFEKKVKYSILRGLKKVMRQPLFLFKHLSNFNSSKRGQLELKVLFLIKRSLLSAMLWQG